jgi:hypothetical protein
MYDDKYDFIIKRLVIGLIFLIVSKSKHRVTSTVVLQVKVESFTLLANLNNVDVIYNPFRRVTTESLPLT